MVKKRQKRKTLSSAAEESELLDLFPEVYEVEKLSVDKNLPLIKLTNLNSNLTFKNELIDLKFAINSVPLNADIFLYVDDQKKDMYYQVGSGEYFFRHVSLKPGGNLIKLFYRCGNKISAPAYYEVTRL